MGSLANSRLEGRLAALPSTFTATQARQAAISSRDLAALCATGDIEELSRGVYRRADAPATAHLALLAVCLRAPRAVVCGESALAIHELIDDIPTSVHIAVPRGTHRPSISYPPTTVTQYAAETFSLAVEQFEAAPSETVPMYSAARSVVDAMRHRRRFGETLALAALGRYLRREGSNGVRDLQEIARDLGALSAVRPSIEAVLA
ncbi:type IV toxin-antitoxin system AbiEi family antitoxin domain-containing protein [Streptosporangium subroseum]|uniref:type IV toxin-antitoxin system AbiEi family antitoxin domain-containing protein n=1 Tax=Streptosporangium subroseum TaxID=106412 RepID=UPI00343E5FE0